MEKVESLYRNDSSAKFDKPSAASIEKVESIKNQTAELKVESEDNGQDEIQNQKE